MNGAFEGAGQAGRQAVCAAEIKMKKFVSYHGLVALPLADCYDVILGADWLRKVKGHVNFDEDAEERLVVHDVQNGQKGARHVISRSDLLSGCFSAPADNNGVGIGNICCLIADKEGILLRPRSAHAAAGQKFNGTSNVNILGENHPLTPESMTQSAKNVNALRPPLWTSALLSVMIVLGSSSSSLLVPGDPYSAYGSAPKLATSTLAQPVKPAKPRVGFRRPLPTPKTPLGYTMTWGSGSADTDDIIVDAMPKSDAGGTA